MERILSLLPHPQPSPMATPRFSDSPNARSKSITTADGLDTFGVGFFRPHDNRDNLIVYFVDPQPTLYRKHRFPSWRV